MNINEIIRATMEGKVGNSEYILTNEDTIWIAAIGNKSEHVSIGENLGYGSDQVDFYAEGHDPMAAAMSLLKKVLI